MGVLVLGLYAEGRSDERFLPIIIQRTAEHILLQHDRSDIDVLDIIVLNTERRNESRDEGILQIARDASGYHAIIVHADADNPTRKQALTERFIPAYRRIQSCEENICKNLLPIIPITMVEAWMLADSVKLGEALGQQTQMINSQLPRKVKSIESLRDPKDKIDQIVRNLYPDQPQHWNRIRGELYSKLAPIIRLEYLRHLTAYNQFVHDLTAVLQQLHFIA